MANRVPGWMKLVAVLFGVAVLLAIGLAAGSFFLLRSSIRQFEAADRSFDEVAERYGAIATYRPEPDGAIPPDRLEAFLEARTKVGSRRARLAKALALLSDGESKSKGGVLRKTRGTVGLLRNLAPFHRERNETLMQTGVGFGEYYYLYTLAYYSWLGKEPADGPTFKIVGENGYLLESIESLEEPVVRRYREEQARLGLNDVLLPVLRNQLAALATEADNGDLERWKEILAVEIAALEADPRRLPWEDSLPEIVERSLRPYREQLADSYSSMCNAVEIGLARRSPKLVSGAVEAPAPDA